MAESPEASGHASVQQRISAVKRGQQPKTLFPLAGNPKEPMPEGLLFQLQDYLEPVDWSGRILRKGKHGAMDAQLPLIFECLQIDPQHWLYLNKNFESRFKYLVGATQSVHAACKALDKHWCHGIRDCERYLTPSAAT